MRAKMALSCNWWSVTQLSMKKKNGSPLQKEDNFQNYSPNLGAILSLFFLSAYESTIQVAHGYGLNKLQLIMDIFLSLRAGKVGTTCNRLL